MNPNARILDITISDDAREDVDLEELHMIYARVISTCLWIAKNARSNYPNFQHMSLMVKCLQHTGIKDYKIFISEAKNDMATAGNHLHKRFKKLFFTANNQNEGDTKDFEEALQTLQQDVLIGSSVLFTTFSNAADKDLIKYF